MTAWLEGTALATWMRESPSIWAYPTILTLHTVGLGIVVGASAVIDFRILGFAPRIRIPSLSPLFGIILWAFVLNAATGLMLFAQIFEEPCKFGILFAGHAGYGCAKAVASCVGASPGLSCFGAGTGGVLCVGPIGRDLSFRRHEK